MKKFLLFSIIFIIPIASAISTDMQATYAQGETIIAEIFGNILEPINPSQIELRRGHVQVPFDYDVKKLGDNYFIYGIAPYSQNDYRLIIKDVKTTVNGVIQIVDFEQLFSTTNESIIYSINPGFASAEEEFEILINLNRDFDEVINIEIPEVEQVTLKPGENRFTFPVISLPPGLSRISIGIYSFPIYSTSEFLDDNNESDYTDNFVDYNFAIFPRTIESTILRNQQKGYPFRLANFGDIEITEVIFIYNEEIFEITPGFTDPLAPDDYIEFNIEIINYEEEINEVIIARVGEQEIEFPITISFTEDQSQVETPYLENYQDNSAGYLCSELSGTFCSAEETCSGEITQALDGNSCCLETCTSDSSSSSFAWIGWLIGAIILIVIIIIAGRYFKTKKLNKGNPLKKKLESKNLKP